MASGQLSTILRYIRRLTGPFPAAELTDGVLLERFALCHDEAAFAALLQRHGPLVWSLCRSVLLNLHDAEDAFQATFLVLVRKCKSISKRESVGSWLYGVAHRIAVRAKATSTRKQESAVRVTEMAATIPSCHLDSQDLAPLLHQEVNRLPEKYRVPVVLCYLQGQTRRKTALQLGCSEGTIKGRLERARDLLRTRLTRRGLVLSAGTLAAALSRDAASATLPVALADSTIKAALVIAAGKTAAAGVVSAQVITLMEGVLKTMFVTKLKILAAAVLTVMVVASGAGLLSYRAPAIGPAAQKAGKVPKPAARDAEAENSLANVVSRIDGIVLVVGTEIMAGEKVPPDLIVAVKVGKEVKKYRRLGKGDKVKEGQLVVFLDDELARKDYAIKEAAVAASEADLDAAEKTRDETYQRYMTNKRLYGNGNGKISYEEFRGSEATWLRYRAESVSKKAAVKVAKLELQRAEIILEMHEIRSKVSGVIKAIYKYPGDAVKRYEPVLQIEVSKQRK